jgi:hypothetical protein
MALKKNYIHAELDWAEKQLDHWKEYVENNPVQHLADRIIYKETKTGLVPQVVASVETQGKFIQETMKNYLALLAEVNNMREVEEAKKQARGQQTVPHRMRK